MEDDKCEMRSKIISYSKFSKFSEKAKCYFSASCACEPTSANTVDPNSTPLDLSGKLA